MGTKANDRALRPNSPESAIEIVEKMRWSRSLVATYVILTFLPFFDSRKDVAGAVNNLIKFGTLGNAH